MIAPPMVSGPVFNSHARALQLVEQGAQRLVVADLERELREFGRQRLARIVAQAGDLPAAFLEDGQGLENVVHLAGFKLRRAASPALISPLRTKYPMPFL